SAGMSVTLDGYADSVTRWSATRDALLAAIKPLASEVRFGLMFYGSGSGQNGACPMFTRVPAALNDYDAIDQKYRASSPLDDPRAPTGQGIAAAAADLLAQGGSDPKYILLVTESDPQTCAPSDPDAAKAESVSAAASAATSGIRTLVVGVGG